MFSSNNQIDVSEMNENYYVVSNKKSIFIAIGINGLMLLFISIFINQ